MATRKPAAPRRDPGPTRAVKFINRLTHTKGEWAGRPFRLRRWQERQIIRPLFSTRADGLRQYRTALLMMPRKNGKTELLAALALYALLGDGEDGAEVYSCAADREQAAIAYHVAAQMIRNDADLSSLVEIVESQKRLVYRATGSFYRALSAEAYSKHGFNCSHLLYDELHAARSRELWDVLTTSQGARLQPLTVAVSTAGYDRHTILWELYAHAQNVLRDPSVDPTFLPIIFEAPIDADWQDEDVWKAANPALGDFRRLDELRVAAARAKVIPAQENTFRRLYLNQWTEQARRWLPRDRWDACRAPLEWEDFRGRTCYVGMDLSTTTDLTAIVAIFPDDEGKRFAILPHGFVPANTVKRRSEQDRVPYDQWADAGFLEVTNGDTINFDVVRARLEDWDRRFAIRQIAYDPWNAADLVRRLQEAGMPCVPVRQAFQTLNDPSKALETATIAGTLEHGGHPVLDAHVTNVAVEQDSAGNIRPSKRHSTDRIDLVVALICAIYAWLHEPEGTTSAYADHPLMIV